MAEASAAARGPGAAASARGQRLTWWAKAATSRALDEAGLPKGVLNLVFGVPATVSSYLIPRPEIRKVSFTGSTAVGKQLAQMAAAEPDKDFIGVEVHSPGVGRLMHLIDESGIENLRAYCDDAVEVLEQCIADNSLSRVQIYFPDPWHKKRHHKRRLVQPEFMQLLRRKLKPGGVIHLATDWENYAEHMMLVMSGAEGFRNTQGEGVFAPRPDFRPVTKFEKRGERLGHGVWDLLFEKTAD